MAHAVYGTSAIRHIHSVFAVQELGIYALGTDNMLTHRFA